MLLRRIKKVLLILITSLSDFCFRSSDGVTYFLKESQYYRFNDVPHEVETGYPKPISTFWKGIPNDVDTVFRWSDDQTYFFKGNYYYQFNFTKGAVDDGYPRACVRSLERSIIQSIEKQRTYNGLLQIK